MLLPASGVVSTTSIALGLLVLAALAFLVSSLYPPLHHRRIVTAAAMILIALSALAAERLPPLRLPLQAVVIADCAVVGNPEFTDHLKAIDEKGPLLRDIRLFILPRWDGTPCAETVPWIAGMAVEPLFETWNRTQALDAATEYLDTSLSKRQWLSWPRRWALNPRIVIAHAQGSALGPETSSQAEEESRVLPDKRTAQLYQHAYGRAAIRHALLTVAPPLLTQEGGTRSVTLEIEDVRLRNAVSAQLETTVRYLRQQASETSEEESNISYLARCEFYTDDQGSIEADLTLPPSAGQGAARSDKFLALEPASDDRLDRLVLYRRIVFVASYCYKASVWVAVTVAATVELADGSRLSVDRTVMLPVIKTTGATLVTPPIDAPPSQRHAAAPGWDRHANQPGYGLDGGSAIEPLLNVLFAATKSKRCGEGCAGLARSILEQTQSCWFRGGDDIADRKTEFENCLEQTRRLALIAPSDKEIKAVGPNLIDNLIGSGKLNVLVAAPAYPDNFSPPAWAPETAEGQEFRTEPRVRLVLSFRDSLRIKSDSGSSLAQQRNFIHAIAQLGVAGPATEASTPIEGRSPQLQCVPGEMFSDKGGLAWFSDPSKAAPIQAPDIGTSALRGAAGSPIRLPGSPHPSRRLKGVLTVEKPKTPPLNVQQRKQSGTYANNLICSSPIVRLVSMIKDLEDRRTLGSPGIQVPRAVIAIMAEDDLHVGLSGAVRYHRRNHPGCLQSALDDESRAKEIIRRYFGAGGSVIIVKVNDANGFRADTEVIRDASGDRLINLGEVAGEIRDLAATQDVTVLRNALKADGTNADTVAQEFVNVLHRLWAMPGRRETVVGAMLGDGHLSDRRDICVPRLRKGADGKVWTDDGCAYESGENWASGLNRRLVAPERFNLLDTTTDPFVSGIFRSCNGRDVQNEIARSRVHRLGRVTALGTSLFSRDMLTSDLSYRPKAPVGTPDIIEEYRTMLRGKCYQQSHGRGADTAPYPGPILEPQQSLPTYGHGGLTLLRRFVELAELDSTSDAPRVVSVLVDPETGHLTVRATGNPTDGWKWDRTVETKDPGIGATIHFSAFDRRTGIAEFEISSDVPYEDILEISLYKRLGDGAEQVPVLLPVSFEIPWTVAAGVRRALFYETGELRLDGQAIAIFGMLVATLVLFSPLSRRWRLAENAFALLIGRGKEEPFTQTSQRAPLFSLEASLTEWGMHPGRPMASRSYGLPAGIRRWRSGDSGGSIRVGTLFPMAVPTAGLPTLMPEVNLRNVSEAAEVVVLVEGTGALASPRPRRAPAKIDFAARLVPLSCTP